MLMKKTERFKRKQNIIKKYARGVMVIVAGYGHGGTSSNPGPD